MRTKTRDTSPVHCHWCSGEHKEEGHCEEGQCDAGQLDSFLLVHTVFPHIVGVQYLQDDCQAGADEDGEWDH